MFHADSLGYGETDVGSNSPRKFACCSNGMYICAYMLHVSKAFFYIVLSKFLHDSKLIGEPT